MQAPIAEAAAFTRDRFHALAKGGVIGLYIAVMRKQPMALHARRSLIPLSQMGDSFPLGRGLQGRTRGKQVQEL